MELFGIVFPIVEEDSRSTIYQSKSYLTEISQPDLGKGKYLLSVHIKACQNQCFFMSVMDLGKFLLQLYDNPRNCYWAHETREIMIAFFSRI